MPSAIAAACPWASGPAPACTSQAATGGRDAAAIPAASIGWSCSRASHAAAALSRSSSMPWDQRSPPAGAMRENHREKPVGTSRAAAWVARMPPVAPRPARAKTAANAPRMRAPSPNSPGAMSSATQRAW